ncbi:MAG: hypothetical protein ACE5GN_07375 [Waddliaceae bacterium]
MAKHSSVDVLDEYVNAFRELINTKVWSRRDKNIRELLRLNKDNDWNFICASMDIVGDACSAIKNFLKYGLEGPTKFDDKGEEYLRLYGMLNATFIQQGAVHKLYKLANVSNPMDAWKRITTLRIREIRNKLGAHSTDYSDSTSGKIESYLPVEVNLSGFGCVYFNNETLKSEHVDFRECLCEHFEVLIAFMDKVYEKTVSTLYKAEKKKFEKFMEKLEKLRIARDGGLVISLPKGQGEELTIRIMVAREKI